MFGIGRKDNSGAIEGILKRLSHLEDALGTAEGHLGDLQKAHKDDYEVVVKGLEEVHRDFKAFIEYADKRVEDGNRVWQRIRSRDSAEKRRLGEEDGGELQEVDAPAGNGEGMQPVHEDLASQLSPVEQVRQQILQSALSRGR